MIWLFLSVTICFSGGWIEKIATPSTLWIRSSGEGRESCFFQKHADDDDNAIAACAGQDMTACVGAQVKLSAAETRDPLGSKLRYSWFFNTRPLGSNATLFHPDSINASFVPDEPGEYYVTLEVKSEDGRTGADTVVIIAKDCSAHPVAAIRVETTVLRPGEVVLSAEDSSCVNDEIVRYEWEVVRKPNGSQTVVTGCEEAYLILDRVGNYRIRLTVGTARGFSDSVEIELKCIDGVIPPVYAYSQAFRVHGVMNSVGKLAVLIEFPGGTGDLTGIAVYGVNLGAVTLVGLIDLHPEKQVYSKVTDSFEQVFVVGKIDEKTVLVQHCHRLE